MQIEVSGDGALSTSDRKVMCSNPTGDRILLMTANRSIAQSLSLSPFYPLDMT